MPKEAPSIQAALTASKESPTLRIHYPGATTTVLSAAGTNLTPAEAKATPTFSIATSALSKDSANPSTGTTATTDNKNKKYIVVSLDLDAPFPSFPFLSPILHGLHIDLVVGDPDAEGFAPLTAASPATTATGDGVDGSDEWVVPYIGPGPPKPSSAHRYVFLVFEQPDDAVAKVRRVLGLGQGKNNAKLTVRVRWDEAAFEKTLGLGKVVAASFFLSRA